MANLFLLMAVAIAAEAARPIDFDTEIMPVFTRAGCNGGACHGAAAGRGGFKLSLLGSNAAADYDAIVRQSEGRRADLFRPADSLVLTKPTGVLEHGGGEPLEYGGVGANLIEAWLAAGAPRGGASRLVALEIEPARGVFLAIGAEVTLSAIAKFSDGQRRDVTPWTLFTAADPDAIEITADGTRAIIRRAGQHTLVARYLDRVTCLQWVVPLGEGKSPPAPAANNFVDREIDATLALLGLDPAPAADDATFLRRATLDLTGRLPTADDARRFMADNRGDKRSRLIDDLLNGDAFVDYWTYKLAKWLRFRSPINEPAVGDTFQAWLREQVANGTGWDETARSLLLTTGDSHLVGPASFARIAADPRSQAEQVGQVFMGVRLACANCHNHPLDRWTQDDYHGLASILARIERGRTVEILPRGVVTNPRNGEPAVPRLPGQRDVADDDRAMAELADWLTAADNPYFARAMVNRLWRALMGRGLVEPVDDMRETNPATHPELLDRLAEDFATHDHDLRHTLRVIATSAAYARGGRAIGPAATDDRFYSRAISRPLEPEVLADALADATGVVEAYVDDETTEKLTRAVALIDGRVDSDPLSILGRCRANDTCDAEGAAATGLATSLHLLNGDFVNRKLSNDQGFVRKLVCSSRANDEILDELYLRCFARPPRDEERVYWRERWTRLEPTANRVFWWEDVAWSLLNSQEFVTNH